MGSETISSYKTTIHQIGQSLSGVAISFVAFKNKLFACSDYGIYLYNPVENKWVEKLNGIDLESSLTWTRSLTSFEDALYCSSFATDLYKSTDLGEHWAKVDLGVVPNVIIQSLVPHNDTLIAHSQDTDGLFTSIDKGLTWQKIKFNLPYAVIWSATFWKDKLVIATTKGVYLWNAKSANWTKLSDLEIRVLHSKGETLLASNQTGLYKWNANEGQFLLSNKGINTARVLDISS